MRTLILSRLSQLVLVLLAVTFLSFSAMNVLGDPLFNIIGPLAELDCDAVARGEIGSTSSSLDATRTDCEIVAEVKAEFRLDEPLLKRYVLWLGDSVRGDFGTSFASEGVPVSEILKNKLPASIKLMIYAEVIALSLAIPLGVVAGLAITAVLWLVMRAEEQAGSRAAELEGSAGFDPDDAMLAVPVAVLLGWGTELIIAAAFGASLFAVFFFFKFGRFYRSIDII